MTWTRAKAAAGAAVASIMVAGAAACSSGPQPPTGMVQGTFKVYAGPASANGQPAADSIAVSGQATFTDASGQTVTVAVPGTGKFTVRLTAGTYTAVLAPANMKPVLETIHVHANQTVKISLDCSWDSGSC